MSIPLKLAQHVVAAGYPFTVRQLVMAFPDLTPGQVDVACWRAARAGWLKRERFGKRSIAYAPGVISGTTLSDGRVRKDGVRAVLPPRPIVPKGIPVGIPASVWDLPKHGWPAERVPTNYWPAEEEEMA